MADLTGATPIKIVFLNGAPGYALSVDLSPVWSETALSPVSALVLFATNNVFSISPNLYNDVSYTFSARQLNILTMQFKMVFDFQDEINFRSWGSVAQIRAYNSSGFVIYNQTTALSTSPFSEYQSITADFNSATIVRIDITITAYSNAYPQSMHGRPDFNYGILVRQFFITEVGSGGGGGDGDGSDCGCDNWTRATGCTSDSGTRGGSCTTDSGTRATGCTSDSGTRRTC